MSATDNQAPRVKECPDGKIRLCRVPDQCAHGNTLRAWSGPPETACSCPSYTRGEWDILAELRAIRKALETRL